MLPIFMNLEAVCSFCSCGFTRYLRACGATLKVGGGGGGVNSDSKWGGWG